MTRMGEKADRLSTLILRLSGNACTTQPPSATEISILIATLLAFTHIVAAHGNYCCVS